MISYAILLWAALLLNVGDMRMFVLALVVGAGIFFPVPDALFYLVCMLVEILVALLALRIDAQASAMVIRMSAMLFVFHGLGWALDGYPVASPYHAAVNFLEHAELVMCCLFSRPILARLNNV